MSLWSGKKNLLVTACFLTVTLFGLANMSFAWGESLPSLQGGSSWINSPPLSRSDLKGKVVLVDFWEYTCVNCVRTFPFLRRMFHDYSPDGLVIIGIHTPEFTFGRVRSNVEAAVRRFGLSYPVIMDNRMILWDRFHNHYWPAEFLFDRSGNLVYHSIGEGDYLETETRIRAALGLPAKTETPGEDGIFPEGMTPELYAGASRGNSYGGEPLGQSGTRQRFSGSSVYPDRLNLSGDWAIYGEFIRPEKSDPGHRPLLRLPYHAAGIHVVLKPRQGQTDRVTVFLDGKPVSPKVAGDDIHYGAGGQSYILVRKARMYNLTRHQRFGPYRLRMEFHDTGPDVYSFTFDPS
uniref:Redoxin domain-containing protein n=1 Tax=Leptospirillum ferriphilum TaxID=178606 RepID=A0A7C3LUW7_9BACT